jgi:hypothetical protein
LQAAGHRQTCFVNSAYACARDIAEALGPAASCKLACVLDNHIRVVQVPMYQPLSEAKRCIMEAADAF